MFLQCQDTLAMNRIFNKKRLRQFTIDFKRDSTRRPRIAAGGQILFFDFNYLVKRAFIFIHKSRVFRSETSLKKFYIELTSCTLWSNITFFEKSNKPFILIFSRKQLRRSCSFKFYIVDSGVFYKILWVMKNICGCSLELYQRESKSS